MLEVKHMASKKSVQVYILEILRRESDRGHRLSQEEIRQLLMEKYEISVDRKTLGRHLNELYDSGDFGISYGDPDKVTFQDNEKRTQFYMENTFTDGELRLLIDGIMFSKHIKPHQRKDIISKIGELSSKHFKTNVGRIVGDTSAVISNEDIFLNIEEIVKAIDKGHKISFKYQKPDVDKKMHFREKDGKPIEYILNPYQILANHGRYYLIGNIDKYDNISTWRIARMKDVEKVESQRKPLGKVSGFETARSFDAAQYMKEHIYMFGGKSVDVVFEADRTIIDQILDWFDGNVTFYKVTDKTVQAKVHVNYTAIKFWALQYLPFVKVLAPTELVEEIRETVLEGAEKYKD